MAVEDARSVSDLLAASVDWNEGDGEGDWTAVTALQRLGTREVLDRVTELTKASDPRVRAQATNILGQLGVPERSFPQECRDASLRLLDTDPNPGVLKAAAIALGHLKGSEGTLALVRLVDHPDHAVRHAAAFALGGRGDAEAVDALIRLTHDSDAAVRDWATFGLGTIGDTDTPRLRKALYERMYDGDDDVCCEAMCGLANRGDLRVLTPLIDAIRSSPEDFRLWQPALKVLNRNDEDDSLTAEQIITWLCELRQKDGETGFDQCR